MPEARFQTGDIVVLRHVETPLTARMVHAYMGDPAHSRGIPFLANGRIVTVMARPYRVVRNSTDGIVLYQPPDARPLRWHIEEQRYMPVPQPGSGSSLRFFYPGKPFDVTMFFEGPEKVPWYYDAFFDSEGMTPGWRERRKAAGESSHCRAAESTAGSAVGTSICNRRRAGHPTDSTSPTSRSISWCAPTAAGIGKTKTNCRWRSTPAPARRSSRRTFAGLVRKS